MVYVQSNLILLFAVFNADIARKVFITPLQTIIFDLEIDIKG